MTIIPHNQRLGGLVRVPAALGNSRSNSQDKTSATTRPADMALGAASHRQATAGKTPDPASIPGTALDQLTEQYRLGYETRAGDTLEQIAQTIWGDKSCWYLLADANDLTQGASDTLQPGDMLKVPFLANNNGGLRAFDSSAILVADITQAAQTAAPPADRLSWLSILLQVVVTVIVTVAVTALTAGAGTIVAGMVGGAVGAIVGDAVGQTSAMAFNHRLSWDNYDWKRTLVAGAAGAIGGALAAGSATLNAVMADKGVLARLAFMATKDASVGVTANSVEQGIRLAAGEQEHFDLGQLAASAVTGSIDGSLGYARQTASAAGRAASSTLTIATTEVGYQFGRNLVGSTVATGINEGRFSPDLGTLQSAAIGSIGHVLGSGIGRRASNAGKPFFKQPERINGKLGYAMGPTSAPRLGTTPVADYDLPQSIVRAHEQELMTSNLPALLEHPDVEAQVLARRDALLRDSEAYYRQLQSNPPADKPAIPKLDPMARTDDIIHALYASSEGVVIGESHSQDAAKKFLIQNMGALKENGVQTLYFEGLNRDFLHQELADFNRTGKSAMLELHIGLMERTDSPYSIPALLKVAQRHQIEIRALGSLASCYDQEPGQDANSFNPGLRHVMGNYIAARIIAEDSAQSPGRKWLALMGAAHAGNVGGRPGVADMTGTISLRVVAAAAETLPAGAETLLTRDRAEPTFRRLPMQGDLRLRVAASAAESTVASNRRSSETAPRPDQPAFKVPQRINGKIGYLLSPTSAPRLEGRKLDDYNLPAHIVSLHEQALMRSDIQALLRQPYLKHMVLTKRDALLNDAKAYYQNGSSVAGPDKPYIPQLDSGAKPEAMIREIYANARGIVIGEKHTDESAQRFLLKHMTTLKENGVRSIYLEALNRDFLHQELAEFNETGQSAKLERHLGLVSWNKDSSTTLDLMRAAQRQQIKIKALGSIASYVYHVDGNVDLEARHLMGNYIAARILTEEQAKVPVGNWLAIMGAAHSGDMTGVSGVANITGAVGLRVEQSAPRTLPPGERSMILPDPGEQLSGDIRIQHDLRLRIADFE